MQTDVKPEEEQLEKNQEDSTMLYQIPSVAMEVWADRGRHGEGDNLRRLGSGRMFEIEKIDVRGSDSGCRLGDKALELYAGDDSFVGGRSRGERPCQGSDRRIRDSVDGSRSRVGNEGGCDDRLVHGEIMGEQSRTE